jgi:hypothetical protein
LTVAFSVLNVAETDLQEAKALADQMGLDEAKRASSQFDCDYYRPQADSSSI